MNVVATANEPGQALAVAPLAGLIGAEVDVDLRRLDDAMFEQVHRAFLEHVILVFPGQRLSADDQLAFARRFGELYRFPHACPVGANSWSFRRRSRRARPASW